jgi:hypothetical protein
MKNTEKFRKAVDRYYQLKSPEKYSTQDELYSLLNSHNYYWDSKNKLWELEETPDPPSELVKIRVMAARDRVKTIVNDLSVEGLVLVETSDPYPCRPPKQNDSRIYLTFKQTSRESENKPNPYDVVLGSNRKFK